MGWFKRHLNLTALIVLAVDAALFYIFYIVSVDFHSFSILQKDMLDIVLIYIVPIITGCFLLLIICYGWILVQKKRSLSFLFLFVLSNISLFILILSIFYIKYPLEFDIYIMNVYLFLCSFVFLVTGLVAILFLKNLSTVEHDKENVSFLSRVLTIIKSKSDKVTLFLLVTVLILLSGFSGYSNYSMNHKYKTYSDVLHELKFGYSFEYPLYYYEAFSWTDDITWEIRDRVVNIYLVNDTYDWISKDRDKSIDIEVWHKRHWELFEYESDEEKYLEHFYAVMPGIFDYKAVIKDFKITSTIVDGNEADYISFTIQERPVSYHFWGTIEAVIFEYGDYFWIIINYYDYHEKQEPDTAFEHLLDTLNVYSWKNRTYR